MSKEWLESVPGYFEGYLKLVEEDDMMEALRNSKVEFLAWVKGVPSDKATYAYDEGKWTVNEVLQHITDTERIFQYRALSIARGETLPLHGYNHNEYVARSNANQRKLSDLTEEFKRLRDSSIDLFLSFTEDSLKNKGTANGFEVQPILIGYLVSGHLRHHLNVLEARY
jgi:uncharacterized damage-inducible protein DinB